MKFIAALLLVAFAILAGCAHRKPKSSAQIIMLGDRNPTIREDAQHAGEIERDSPRRR